MRQNEPRDSIANLLSDIGHIVEIELHLQPLQVKTFAPKSTTIYDEAILDINANGLCSKRTLFKKNLF